METAEWIAAVGVVTLIACVVQVLTGQWLTGMQWVSVVKDLAMAGAAFLAAYVGWRGLSTWERQLKGNAEFECARAMARATYSLRDQVRYMRAPLLAASEFPDGYTTRLDPSREERARAEAHVYNNRWTPVREAMLAFDLRVLEAEAIWGPEIARRANELRTLVGSLFNAVEAHVEGVRSYTPPREDLLAFRREMQLIIAGTGGDNDEFWSKVQRAINGIDEVLKPHLRWFATSRGQ